MGYVEDYGERFFAMFHCIFFVFAVSLIGGFILTLFGIFAWYIHENGLMPLHKRQKPGYMSVEIY